MKIERLYSDYQEEERLYSTGNDELDELLERAFCDGYEYAQKEFGNPINKAKRKAVERSMAKGTLKSLGFNTNDKKDVDLMIRVNRARNRAGVTGAEIKGVYGVINSLGTKARTVNPSIHQRISAKGALDRGGNVKKGWDRPADMKKIMANRDPSPNKRFGDRNWESFNYGESNQDLWDITR